MKLLYYIYLLFLIVLNFNYIFKIDINKFPSYFALSLLILINSLLLLKSRSKISLSVLFYFYVVILFFSFQFFRIYVFNYLTHFFYVSSLLICISHVYLVLNSDFKFEYKFFPVLVKYSLRISLITAIIGLFTNPFMFPGWIWPMNIALQEIILISLFFSEVMFFGLKGSKFNLILFLLLVFFRDSGKATFLSLSIFVVLEYFFKTDNQKKIINFSFNFIWLFHFLFVGIAFLLFEYVKSLEKTNLIRYFFIKRFVYIQESVTYLSDWSSLFTGGGFGPENYFAAAKNLTVLNAPQLLPLTILVFGGLILYFLYLFLSLKLFNYFDLSSESEFYLKCFFLSILIIMTFHEYFVNPFVYISIGLVLFSYKSIKNHHGI